MMKHVIRKAKEFQDSEISRFKSIVLDAGEASKETFDLVMENNPYLMFVYKDEEIVGVGALKIPLESHKAGVFKKSGTDCLPQEFKYELGWIVSLDRGKGIGKRLSTELSNLALKIYATVRADNKPMRGILEKLGYALAGNPYKSSRGDYQLVMYIKKD